jgi:glycosyltransferase involved in cell wall biosynthesis
MKVGIVVPHIFMHEDILPRVIFSPAMLALELAEGLGEAGAEVTLFTPGPVNTKARNLTADLSYFEAELKGRGDSYLDLLKKHPLTFVTLARQVQSELVARAYDMANNGELDLVHIYTNEEDIALPFAKLCVRPVVFTHHDPFNFLVRYKAVMPKYTDLPWISLSFAQRRGMPDSTNWAGNVYHGLAEQLFIPNYHPAGEYIAYLGRIIEPKGVHLAIAAVKAYNKTHKTRYKLKIAGKHYSSNAKDTYWQTQIAPHIDNEAVIYEGFIGATAAKQAFLGNARALLVPSTFEEPFGMVVIEALACGTPVIGLNSGAIPEIIQDGVNGLLVPKGPAEAATIKALAQAIGGVEQIDRNACRASFEDRFTAQRMCQEHLSIYRRLIQSPDRS